MLRRGACPSYHMYNISKVGIVKEQGGLVEDPTF